jgi:alpha-galactosidase
VQKTGELEVWSKQLADGGRAVALVNRSKTRTQISVAWTEIGYPDSLSTTVRDLWAHKEVTAVKGGYSAEVPSHGVVLLRMKP